MSITALLIIFSIICVLITYIIYLFNKFTSEKKEEEIIPVENYDLIKSSKPKTKKVTKSKTKK